MKPYPDDEPADEPVEEDHDTTFDDPPTCSRCGTLITNEVPIRAWQEVEVQHVFVPVAELTFHWECYVTAARNGEL